MLTYNDKNLRKHNVTPQEVDQVLDVRNLSTRHYELSPSHRGNDRAMFVGFTFDGRFLEVGVETISEDGEYVFHADDATKQYRE